MVMLFGLTSLSDAAAGALANGNMISLSDDLPDETIKRTKTLSLAVAKRYLADPENNPLFHLSWIDVDAAEALSKCEDLLFLDGLTTISVEVAEALAKCEEGLSLSGLETISVEVAEALAKCEGMVMLFGLTSLSDAAADALAKSDMISLPDDLG
jgi:hypothetical protein